jgi:hypothetical protein
MVPNWGEVLGFGGAAALYWSALGWPLARRCLPRALSALAFAPLLGWAVQTALAASLLPLTSFGIPALLAVALAPLALVWTLHWRRPPDAATQPLSLWTLPFAALLACLPTAAILPKHTQGGISLASPIFDHSKIAIIDAIARLGLPPVNPYYGGAETGPHLAYYYWWHLSAAELARLAGATGWAADAAMTWFTAAAGFGRCCWRSRPRSARCSPLRSTQAGSYPRPASAAGSTRQAGRPSTSPPPPHSSWPSWCWPASPSAEPPLASWFWDVSLPQPSAPPPGSAASSGCSQSQPPHWSC